MPRTTRSAANWWKPADAWFAVAITYGKMLPYLGSKEQVAATPLIKAAADKTLRLDARNDTAWHILGRWHRVLADVQRQVDALLEHRLREALAPLLAQVADTLAVQARELLASSLRDLVSQAVTHEIDRQRGR